MENKKVLIASPVRQNPKILKEFLFGLKHLERNNLQVDLAFIDNNSEEISSKLLQKMVIKNSIKTIINIDTKDTYACNEETHHWSNGVIWKVAEFKNTLIRMALEQNYDYIFLVDSDLILHPKTLTHLVSLNKDIVSEVFWTKWFEKQIYLPQVWMTDEYNFFTREENEEVSVDVATIRIEKFIKMLEQKGIYKVGGLGACTLISRDAIQKGVSFGKIYNLSFAGEDRHFCIRAVALGLELYADTHYRPFHIYRESDLPKAMEYKKEVFPNLSKPQKPLKKMIYSPKLTLTMIVKNEAGRYLKEVLESAREYIDNAVIIDDASEDGTVEICKEVLNGIPLKLISNKESVFKNEVVLRKQQWNEVLQTNPDWILSLDADEIFENKAKDHLRQLLYTSDIETYLFRLYDFWDADHYREDAYWQAHNFYRHFLIKYNPDYNYLWREQPQHCGRFPYNIAELRGGRSELRVKHLGWATPMDRLLKYQRYSKLDSGAKYGIAEQYESILDPRPNLVKWDAL